MGFDSCLIGVTLHEHIGIRRFTVVDLIQQAALLVFVDFIDELSRDLLEFRAVALLDLDLATVPNIRVSAIEGR